MLLQYKEREEVINCGLHDLPHFTLRDVRILWVAVASGAGLPRMDILNWSIAESQRDERLGFSGHSGQVLGNGRRFFHTGVL